MASVARYKFVPSMIQEQDDVFYQVLDEGSVLTGLTNETSPTKRTAILEGLRDSVRRSGGRLHIQERFALFNAIHNVLLDNDVNTRLACLNFICEVIPDFGNDLDDCMSFILPQLVVFIGHNQVSLKKLAVQTLHVYMKHSDHLENVLNAIIQLGLESENVDTRTESLIALPILITPNFADEDLFLLTEALVRRIADNSTSYTNSTTDTTSLAMISLDRIRNVVGKRNFEVYIQRLSPALQNVLAKAMKGEGNNDRNKSRKAKSATGVPLEENQQQKTNLDKGTLDRCFTIAGFGCESTVDADLNEEYLPSGVMRKLKDPDWRLKEKGIEELRIWLERVMEPVQLLPHLEHFVGVLKELLGDSNFKVNLTSLQLVGTMIDKLGTNIEPILEPLVSALANKLGDNKNVMKQTNMQVFKKLMQNLSPKQVLKVLKVNIKHRNSRVREETLNVIIAALLTFPSNEFDLPELTSNVAPALIDPKRRVRHAALEAFAVISQAMGPCNLHPLVSTVDNIELQMGGDGVMAAVQARFARRQLPKLNSDGLVEYAMPLPSAGSAKVNVNMSPRGADVEWILAGGSSSDCPSSARSTPGLNDSGVAISPRRHVSAGKNRLPWENGEKATNGVPENNPPKVKNSWGVDDKHDSKVNKNTKDGFTNEAGSGPVRSSYAVKYNARKSSTVNSGNQPESSNVVTSYAHLHKTKSAKGQSNNSLSSKSIKGGNLGPIVNGANGYSLIYKKGTLSGRPAHEYRKGLDSNNNSKSFVRNNIGAKSLSPFDSRLPKSPGDKTKQNIFGMKNTSLSASLPDWSELSSRPRKLLSPVPPNFNRDEDNSNLSNASGYNESPIQTKPMLVRSASKKGRNMLKSIDFSDSGLSPRISDTSSPTQLSPVTPKEPLPDHHRHTARHSGGRNLSPLSSDPEDSPGRHHRQAVGNRTWSAGSRKFDEDSVPFDKKPRIARTPVHLRRRSSSDVASDPTPTAEPSRNARDSNRSHVTHVPSRKVSQSKSGAKETENNDIEKTEKKGMEIVGHAFDTVEKRKNGTMQSTLNSTSGIGSSLEESGELGSMKIGGTGILMNEKFSSDETEDTAGIEDIDDYELDYEEDTELADEPNARHHGNRAKHAGLIKEYQEHVDKLDQADIYSESMYDDSEGESLEDSEEDDDYDEEEDEEEDYPSAGFPVRPSSPDEYDKSRDQRQSLSKSTRERMERKRVEEEERILRERQRIEELERQNQLRLESKEQSFRDKLAREQRDIENLIKRKEKERELEKLKQEKLQKQLEKKEDASREEFWRSKSYLEDLEKSKEVHRQKDRAEKLKKLHQRKEHEVNDLEVRGNVVNEVDDHNEDLAIQGHHTPSVANAVINKPPLAAALKKKSSTATQNINSQPQQSQEKASTVSEPSSSRRSHAASASSNPSVPTWEVSEGDLKPFSNGEAAVKTSLRLLADGVWESKCEGLVCVRRIIRHHTEHVIPQLHVIILAVVNEVKNLRSQVFRAAIYTLGDMYTRLEKHMDLDLELTTNVLLKKAGEASGFIRGDVEHALGCMVSSVTSSKAISALVTGGSRHRNVHVRRAAAQFLCMLAERMGPSRCLSGSKDITERILVAAAVFASDGGAETRYYGRRILLMLDSHVEFERMLNKYLPEKSLKPTMTIVENLRTKGLGDVPSDVSSARARKPPVTSGIGSRSSSIVSSTDGAGPSTVVSNVTSPVSTTSREGSRRHSRRVSHEAATPQDQEHIISLVQQLSSNDWKERIQGIDNLVEMTQTRLSLFNSNIVKILDGFTPRLVDNNSKVNLHALQSLHTIIPIIKDNLNSSVASIIPSVAKNLASKNNTIGSMAEDVLDTLIRHVDNARLLQPLCQFISNAPGGVRNRPSAVKRLLAVITDVYPRKPSSVCKHALPVLWKLLESSSSASSGSGNMKEAMNGLSRLLYSLMGESLFEYAAAKSQRIAQKLKELLEH